MTTLYELRLLWQELRRLRGSAQSRHNVGMAHDVADAAYYRQLRRFLDARGPYLAVHRARDARPAWLFLLPEIATTPEARRRQRRIEEELEGALDEKDVV